MKLSEHPQKSQREMSIGPIVEGSVEFPVGSGHLVPAFGMLSKHPQCDLIRGRLKDNGWRDWPDEPIVFDQHTPIGTLYLSPDWGAGFMNPRTTKIEKLWVVPSETVKAIAEEMGLL